MRTWQRPATPAPSPASSVPDPAPLRSSPSHPELICASSKPWTRCASSGVIRSVKNMPRTSGAWRRSNVDNRGQGWDKRSCESSSTTASHMRDNTELTRAYDLSDICARTMALASANCHCSKLQTRREYATTRTSSRWKCALSGPQSTTRMIMCATLTMTVRMMDNRALPRTNPWTMRHTMIQTSSYSELRDIESVVAYFQIHMHDITQFPESKPRRVTDPATSVKRNDIAIKTSMGTFSL
mmetsp:Transcript_8069/g.25612  ORF Transcript_8069/g.25612 Transcript_8069/m.25612 type:complete len:241 (-) Transcript_8069:603-1325(-)